MQASAIHAVVFTILSTLPTPASDKPRAGDMAALQGTWKVWFEKDDYTVFKIDGNSFTLTRHTGTNQWPTMTGSFSIDETALPKAMTWKDLTGGGVNLDINRCIYELHGDTLLLIGGVHERPEQFYSGDGRPHKSWILKRETKVK